MSIERGRARGTNTQTKKTNKTKKNKHTKGQQGTKKRKKKKTDKKKKNFETYTFITLSVWEWQSHPSMVGSVNFIEGIRFDLKLYPDFFFSCDQGRHEKYLQDTEQLEQEQLN